MPACRGGPMPDREQNPRRLASHVTHHDGWAVAKRGCGTQLRTAAPAGGPVGPEPADALLPVPFAPTLAAPVDQSAQRRRRVVPFDIQDSERRTHHQSRIV